MPIARGVWWWSGGKELYMEYNRIIHGKCEEVLKSFPDNYIDLTVTSPPYDNLRTYKGYTFNFKDIANELFRVTKNGGVVVWVVGDATIKGSETGTSFKQALYFKEIGFNLHDTMIYEKQFYIPLTHNRYEQCFEYMFVFSKSKPKTFNPIKINTLFGGKKSTITHRKTGEQPIRGTNYGKERKYTRIIENIWKLQPQRKSEHPAVFPEKLANDHILSWSNKGDIVLDPMCGSGTTCKMAKINGRKYIGIDSGKEYCELSRKRVNATPVPLFQL